MKLFHFITLSLFSFQFSFAQKYLLDSTETHAYLKLSSYPFLYPNANHETKGSFAIGPSASISGEHFEIQVGILFHVQKYKTIDYPSLAGQSILLGPQPQTITFHNYYLPLLFNYYFKISKRFKCFPIVGVGRIVNANPNYSHGWLFAGGGLSYKLNDKLKLNFSIHERLAGYGFLQGSFFEITYCLNCNKSNVQTQ